MRGQKEWKMKRFREDRETKTRYSLEFKAMVVMTADKEDLEVRDVAARFGISHATAFNWMTAKMSILETYCMRQKLKENPDAPFIVYAGERKYELLLEDPVPKKINAEDAVKQLKDANKKIDFLEDKLAYYDSLLEVLGITPSEAQKKIAMRRSEEQVGPGGNET